MRVTARSGDRQSKEWRCPLVTVVPTNSSLEYGCPRVPRWGCPPYPKCLHFPRTWLSLCPDSPHVTKDGCPHIPATSSPLTVAVLTPRGTAVPTCVPAIPTSPLCHPRVSLSPCPQCPHVPPIPISVSHRSPRVPPPSPSRVPAVHRPRRPLASSQSKFSPPRPCPHGGGMKRGVPVTANLPAPVAVLGASRPIPQ